MTTGLSQITRESATDSKRNCCLIAALLISLLPFAGTAFALDDLFMKVDGVQGDSLDKAHPGEIDLIIYSQTFGTKACSEVLVTRRLDSASPQLVARAVNNLRLASVIVAFRRPGEVREYFRATLQSVLIDRI